MRACVLQPPCSKLCIDILCTGEVIFAVVALERTSQHISVLIRLALR